MSTNNVLRLEEYRDRRAHRLEVQRALSAADPSRAVLFDRLAALVQVTGADRAAVIWVDEYGPGLVHPHVVLDLASDRPRRAFPLEPLREAWESGVPGLIFRKPDPLVDRRSWTLALALGSDGARSWFLAADSHAPGQPSEAAREAVMFLGGECSAVVLHRDLEEKAAEESPDERTMKFAGWPILRDIDEGRTSDAESDLIARRFIVGRLPRLLVEDDLTQPLERFRESAEAARKEARTKSRKIPRDEALLWEALLDAYARADFEDIAWKTLALGERVEAAGHVHGALELYAAALDIAAAVGLPAVAVDAARFRGRVRRRMARWGLALRWYGVARRIAEVAGMKDRVAVILDGVASVHRERGNLPAAREALREAMAVAQESQDRRALGSVHQGFLSVEQAAGNLREAMEHGWRAVRTFGPGEDRIHALASLGGVLADAGELDAAEDAWTAVSLLDENRYYQIYAADALAYVSALRGDEEEFKERAAGCDALGWKEGPASARAEILLHRGLAYWHLGRLRDARRWLEDAVAFAEEHRFSQVIFRAERALREVEKGAAAARAALRSATEEVVEMRAGLQTLREELAGAAH